MPAIAQLDFQIATSIPPDTQRTLAKLMDAAYAENTRKGQVGREGIIRAWATSRGVELPLSSQDIAILIADCVQCDYAFGYIQNILSTVRRMHRQAGAPDPTDHFVIKQILRGAQKTCRPESRKAPVLIEHIKGSRALAQADHNRTRGVRDFSVLTTGFAGATRSEDLMGMRIEHLNFSPDDRYVRVFIPRSKTDQNGFGQEIMIYATGSPTCPVAALKRWLAVLGRTEGPVFSRIFVNGRIAKTPLSHSAINNIIKRFMAGLGLDADQYGSHSMRAGFVTEGLRANIPEAELMVQTRHTKISTLQRYHRPPDAMNFTQRMGM